MKKKKTNKHNTFFNELKHGIDEDIDTNGNDKVIKDIKKVLKCFGSLQKEIMRLDDSNKKEESLAIAKEYKAFYKSVLEDLE